MKLAFISQTAHGRLHERANALTDELIGTRVQIVCADIMSGPTTSTVAGRQMHNLMRAMRLLRFVHGSELHELRQPVDLDVAVKAILDKAHLVHSVCYPAGPQATSLVIVADPMVLRELAPRFGVEFDPTALFTVVDVDLAQA